MLSIGIDVSKGKSTVCGMKPGGEIVYTPFEVQHTREGMSELVSLLRGSGEDVRVVLESTGSYQPGGGCFVGERNIRLCRQFAADEAVLLAKHPQGEDRSNRRYADRFVRPGLLAGASTDQTAGGYISGASALSRQRSILTPSVTRFCPVCRSS